MQKAGQRGIYLNHVVGAGKSRTALGVAKMTKAQRVLVIAPLVALGVWRNEIRKWWPIAGFQNLRDDDTPLNNAYAPMVVAINYDMLKPARLKQMRKWKPDLLIVDEAHYAKSPSSKRGGATRRLAELSKFTLLLSGTPAHSPLDWWGQMRMIAPSDPVWSKNYTDYKKRIAIFGGPTQSWVVGHRESEVQAIFEQNIKPYIHVVGRSELKFPEPIETVVPVQLGENAQMIYDDLEKDAVAEFEGRTLEPSNVLAKITLSQQLINGNPLLAGDSTKLQACLDLIEQRPDQKIVVACNYLNDIERIENALVEKNLGFYTIQGSTPSDIRSAIEMAFQTGVGGGVVIVQYQAGGVALTLSKADTMIFFSLPTSVIQFEQMRGRIDRPGKPDMQEILILQAEDTFEEDLYPAIKAKLDDVSFSRRLTASAIERVHTRG